MIIRKGRCLCFRLKFRLFIVLFFISRNVFLLILLLLPICLSIPLDSCFWLPRCLFLLTDHIHIVRILFPNTHLKLLLCQTSSTENSIHQFHCILNVAFIIYVVNKQLRIGYGMIEGLFLLLLFSVQLFLWRSHLLEWFFCLCLFPFCISLLIFRSVLLIVWCKIITHMVSQYSRVLYLYWAHSMLTIQQS